MKQHVQIYKALADETRLRILALLLSEGELCICDIFTALKLPQSTISRHLAYLRKAKWVRDRRCGLWIYYSILADGTNHAELIPVLKKQLLNAITTVEDRKVLAGFGAGNHCE